MKRIVKNNVVLYNPEAILRSPSPAAALIPRTAPGVPAEDFLGLKMRDAAQLNTTRNCFSVYSGMHPWRGLTKHSGSSSHATDPLYKDIMHILADLWCPATQRPELL